MSMLRWLPGFLALALAVLWLMGLMEGATDWLTWWLGALAIPTLAVTGLVPERSSSPSGGVCLGLVFLALIALWVVGRRTGADGWLVWWTLVMAVLVLGGAAALVAQGALDLLRSPE
jgi:hypothetical protein